MPQHHHHLPAYPFAADRPEFGGVLHNRLFGGGFNVKPKAGRKPDGPQHAKPVFRNPCRGITNGPNTTMLLQIGNAIVEVNDLGCFFAVRIFKQPVDGEISASRILFHRGSVQFHIVRATAIA